MPASVTPKPAPSLEGSVRLALLEEPASLAQGMGSTLTRLEEPASLAQGMGSTLTRQVSAAGAAAASTLMTRSLEAVTAVALAIWSNVLGIATRIWARISLPIRSISLPIRSITIAERLRVFQKLLGRCNRESSEAAKAQLKTAYEELPLLIRRELNNQIQGSKQWISEKEGIVDIVHMCQFWNIASLVELIYQDLPSVQLEDLKARLSRKITDSIKIDLLYEMGRIGISDLEPDVTDDVLNAHVLSAFDGLQDSLKKCIYEKIRTPLFESERMDVIGDGDKRAIIIDNCLVSLDDPNLASLIVRSMPRGHRVQTALVRLQADLEDMEDLM